MKYIFNFPDIGEGLEEGVIAEWHVKKGQTVEAGDNLVTMETDKVVTAIPSPKSGVITQLFGGQGDTILVDHALVEIEIEGVEGEAAQEEVKKGSDLEQVEEEGAGVVGTLEVANNSAVMSSSSEGTAEDATPVKAKGKKVLATPVARAMAKDMGVDIQEVIGTGPGGRVMKADIKKHKEGLASAVNAVAGRMVDPADLVEVEPISQIRKTIARNMVESKHKAAHMSVFDEVEISELDRVRKKYKESYEVKLTYLAFVVKATAMALKKFKALNSTMDEENNQMIYKKYYHIGIAVDTPKGLVVPVIRDAGIKSVVEIAADIVDLSTRAREDKLTMEDFKDGTFTITSYGSIGGQYATPVINYPQAGILGIGRVSKQPVVKNDELAVGLVMPLVLTADHRIVDGGDASRFVNTVMGYLADPVSMIFE
jgi:pyruvate dehydrogenase E2 component (dihydrolipoamide acetyltransferase)